jgi:tRNA-Thr(GGU) m(6)t(6)A37 methyltransferase TsaA
MEVIYHPIGVIHSPFTDLREMPIQPAGDASAPGYAELFPEYARGLKDLEGFSHVILLYHLHEISTHQLIVTPFLDSQPRGVFATRAPVRPNPIGLSTVELTGIHVNELHFANLDILDGSPLLDIKPYIPTFDAPDGVRIGWLENTRGDMKSTRSDGRFS